MDWQLTIPPRGDRVSALYQQVRAAVLDGRLRPGDRLPPTRELAVQVRVARGTVAAAYDRLTAEGFLVARVGAGTFVADGVRPARDRRAPGGAVRPRAAFRDLAPLDTGGPPSPVRADLSVGMPDPALFPLATWRRLVSAELRPRRIAAPAYQAPEGHPGLRAAIARHLGLARGLHAGPDDVVVTTGAQQAFDLVARVLVEPGTVVAVEEPGYPPVRRLWAAHGARVHPVPVDEEGIRVDALPAARLVHVTPSHQFPLGPVLSPARRAALLEWAERRGAVIVEDDYDSEYRWADRPLEPLQARDAGGRVVYVGTFSKTLLPMLRLGFLVAPASLRPALRTARQLADWHGDPVAQGALARFVDEGQLARHVRRTAKEYRARRQALLDGLPWTPVPSAAGLHVAALVPGAAEIAAYAARRGVRVETVDRYGDAEGLAFGFGLAGVEEIAYACEVLGEAAGR